MSTYNLTLVVKFPMKVAVIKVLIDNVFLDNMKCNCICLSCGKWIVRSWYSNYCSAGDANSLSKNYSTHKTGFINNETVAKFHLLLTEESWDSVYNADDINYLFEKLW